MLLQLLECQQQLAVAAETDRKKDKMVEQLDRTLAQVVENWKRTETERQQRTKRLQLEHEQMTSQFSQQQQVPKRASNHWGVWIDLIGLGAIGCNVASFMAYNS